MSDKDPCNVCLMKACKCPPTDLQASGHPSEPSEPSRVTLVGTSSDGLDGSDRSPEGQSSLSDLLEDLEDFAGRFIAWPSASMGVAWSLWIAHAYVIDLFDSTPRLGVIAPEKQSGKTRVLEVSEAVLPNPKRASDVSVAVLFRMISAEDKPVILLDEADAIWSGKGSNEDLRSLVNGGHRRGNAVMRMVGEGAAMRATEFDTFAALALAGIGDLPETVMDRSVLLRMKRRRPTDRVERWRFRQGREEGEQLRQRLTTWAATIHDVPFIDDDELIHDRTFDVWEPLFAVAALAGGEWPSRARQACLDLAITAQPEDYSLRLRAVSDLRVIWPEGEPWVETSRLIDRLHKLEDSPWGSEGPLGDQGLTSRKLALFLRHYDVKPHHNGDKTARGYFSAHLADAWERYLPPEASGQPSNPSEPSSPDDSSPSPTPFGRVGRVGQVSRDLDEDTWEPDYLIDPEDQQTA